MSASPVSIRGRDLLRVGDLELSELQALLELAGRIKRGEWRETPLAGRFVAMLFQKASNRTRVSFEVAIARLGGSCLTLSDQEVRFGERETIPDAARVLERYVDVIVARLHRHADLVAFAQWASIPVINALTEVEHPCQILADLLTMQERLGGLEQRTVAYVGDPNNIAASLAAAAALIGFKLRLVHPPDYPPDSAADYGPATLATTDLGAVDGVDVIYTDVWTSMGREAEHHQRRLAFAEYQVNDGMLARAPRAIFMHCLPAHRGEEVTDSVMDGPRSSVFDQAENRLHAQMALLAMVMG